MGRKRKITLSDLETRTLECKCGRMIEVQDKQVVEVTCQYCLTKTVPYSLLNEEQIAEMDALEDAKAKKESEQKPVRLSKNGKPLGRPRKKKANPQDPLNFLTTYKKDPNKGRDEIYQKGSRVTVVGEATKPKRIEKAKVKLKVKSAKKGKTIMNKTKGKRGRKPTVGAKVLSYITSQNGNVEFQDILKVYTEERERLGKRSDKDSIEERNCRSTLYILVRDGKLKEVKAKQTYTTI